MTEAGSKALRVKAATLDSSGAEGEELARGKKTSPLSDGATEVFGHEEAEALSEQEPLNVLCSTSALRYRTDDSQSGILGIRFKLGLIILSVFSLLLVVPWYILRKDPVANLNVQHALLHFQKISNRKGLGVYTKGATDIMVRQLKIASGPGSERAAKKSWTEMDCTFLAEEAISRKLRETLDNVGRYLLLSCLLFQDSPRAISQVIKANYGDPRRFLANLESWELLPEQLVVVEAQRRIEIFSGQPQQSLLNCRRWVVSSACLLRFVEKARQPLRVKLDDGYFVLKKGLNQMNPILQAWLGLAAGINATKNTEYIKAEQFLSEAANLFPAIYDPFLQREIFRSRLFNAERSHNINSFTAIWNQRPTKLMDSDERAFLDVQLLRVNVLNPDRISEALSEFFSQPESTQRFSFDPDFVQNVAELSIRHHQSFAGLTYLDRVTAQQVNSKALDGERLPILRARLLLANSRFGEMLKELQLVEKSAFRSQEFFHLKGAALLGSSDSKRTKLLAAVEFQKAVNIQPHTEHFVALFLAFIEAEELSKAEAVLQFWKRMKLSAGDEPWQALMEGLLRYRRSDRGGARRTWAEIGLRYPDFELVGRITRNLEEDPHYLELQVVKRLTSMFAVDGPLGPLVRF